jgi:hypothetical protein
VYDLPEQDEEVSMSVPSLSSVASLWADYRRKVIPATASTDELVEYKQAFYAGAIAAVNVITESIAETSQSIADILKAVISEIEAQAGIEDNLM